MYKSKALNTGNNSGQATIAGDLWNGVHIVGTPIFGVDSKGNSFDDLGYSKEHAYAATLADRFEFGKASLYAALQYRDTETESASGAKVSKDSLILPLLSLISLSKIYQYTPAMPNPTLNR